MNFQTEQFYHISYFINYGNTLDLDIIVCIFSFQGVQEITDIIYWSWLDY